MYVDSVQVNVDVTTREITAVRCVNGAEFKFFNFFVLLYMTNTEGDEETFANKNASDVIRDAVRRRYQSGFCFQNIMPFHSTCLNVISRNPQRKSTAFPAPIVVRHAELNPNWTNVEREHTN
jgi:hypothetical protein